MSHEWRPEEGIRPPGMGFPTFGSLLRWLQRTELGTFGGVCRDPLSSALSSTALLASLMWVLGTELGGPQAWGAVTFPTEPSSLPLILFFTGLCYKVCLNPCDFSPTFTMCLRQGSANTQPLSALIHRAWALHLCRLVSVPGQSLPAGLYIQ